MLKDSELPLSDVLQAKALLVYALTDRIWPNIISDTLSKINRHMDHCQLGLATCQVSAVRAMAEATASYKFENAKHLKHLRDVLSKEQRPGPHRLIR